MNSEIHEVKSKRLRQKPNHKALLSTVKTKMVKIHLKKPKNNMIGSATLFKAFLVWPFFKNVSQPTTLTLFK